MLKRWIQGLSSTNCIALVFTSKCVHSGIVTARPAIAPTSASQRRRSGLWSPAHSTSTPARIGIQLAKERSIVPSPLFTEEPERQDDDADTHGEGVLAYKTRLEHADHASRPAHHAGRA